MKNKLLLLLLGLLGMTGCNNDDGLIAPEYGIPYVTYTIKVKVKVKVKVTDTQGTPIKGIAVTRYKTDPGIRTDEKGDYILSERSNYLELELTFTDTDGVQNGGEFAEKIVEVEMTEADKVSNGTGWYDFDYAKTVNVTLDKKE